MFLNRNNDIYICVCVLQVALGAIFRVYLQVAEWFNWQTKECWNIDRGEGFTPVQSCEGFGEPSFFYLEGVWTCAGATTFLMFLLGTQLRCML